MPSDRDTPRGWPEGFGVGPAERRALLALATLFGLTPRQLHAHAWRVGTARGCLAAVRAATIGSDGDREHLERVDLDEVDEAVDACGARLISPRDDEYLGCLLDLEDPPAALFVRGGSLRADIDRVSIVGSRKASALGLDVARDLGGALGGAGVWVVSGAARGIDAASHQGALAATGRTIAVLGSGIDVFYPRGSAELLTRILDQGSVVSEYAPGVPAEGFRFPARNRLIAAFGRALVVVEGGGRSGSLISVDHALDLGREVFAVPGPVTSPLSEVPLKLIRDGATMIRGAEDLLGDLGIAARLAVAPPPDLSPDEARVWAALAGQALPEAVARSAGLPTPDAVSALIRLELRGLVRGVGGRFERCLVPTSVG